MVKMIFACFITFNFQDAGDGPLNVTIDGPAHCPCTIGDKLDGTFTAEFTPTVPGIYTIGIKMGENPTDIPGLFYGFVYC